MTSAAEDSLLDRPAQLQVTILDPVYVTRILVHDNVVFGAYDFDLEDGSRYITSTPTPSGRSRGSLRNLMTEHAGVVREESGLRAGLGKPADIEGSMSDVGVPSRYRELPGPGWAEVRDVPC